jgi:plastocyanin
MSRRLVALLAVALLSAAACGDSSDEGDAAPNAENGAGESGLTVRATDFAFDPETLDVAPGEPAEITFVNAGNVTHSFTAEDLDVDVEAATGEETTASFTAPDEDTTVEFVCKFHPAMQGEITVGAGGGGAGGGGGGSSGGGSEDSDSFDY